ncbi:TBC1 domain family member 7, partial [Chrysoperla carnea]|uniref:TBC1 domain family member 7 n=1 Tax=Chrysoperla carnea TaxID=189513 RepID=UPI001D072AF7
MTTDERNFRSTYYEKVGFKGVEEKKSLEILLKEKPLDKVKLKQFCLRFTVPAIYRNLLWKILLDVIPVYVDAHPFVMQQREQQYKDLEHALKVMRFIDSNTTKSAQYYAMWSLEYTNKINYITQYENSFIAIAQCLIEMFAEQQSQMNNIDIYWLTKGFNTIVIQYYNDIPICIERMITLLEKEDAELYKCLEKLDAFKVLPFTNWYLCCFAGVINETSLAKIWDKLCAGSFKILVFVGVVLLTTLRRVLIRCTNAVAILECIEKITEETAEVIVNKAIEVWQQNGCALTLQSDQNVNTTSNIYKIK